MSADTPKKYVLKTSAEAPVRQSLSEWNGIIGREFGRQVALAPARDSAFSARMSHLELGDFALSRIHADGHEVHHEGSAGGDVHINFLSRGGTAVVEQDARRATIAPGGYTVTDAARDYSIRFDGDFRLVVLHVPHRLMRAGLGSAAGEALAVAGGDPEARAFRELTRALAEATAAGPSRVPGRGSAVGQLLARAAADTALAGLIRVHGGDVDPGELGHLARARALIEHRLEEPDLDPRAIAAGVHLSLRQLHTVFAEEGSSVMAEVQERRLQRSRELLAERRGGAPRPVSRIALESGFRSASHFGRLFRERFGVTPGAYREESARSLPAPRMPDTLALDPDAAA